MIRSVRSGRARRASIVALSLSLGACSFIDDFGKFDFHDGMDAEVPGADAGTDGETPLPDGCSVVGEETCNGVDDDCDTRVDEAPTECGGPNELTLCSAGVCTVSGCVDGWGDCDSGTDGCERDITRDRDACGGCGIACTPTQACAGATCSAGGIGWSSLVTGVQWQTVSAGERALIAGAKFVGSVTVGDATFTSRGGEDALVVRVDEETGAPLWARRLGGAGGENIVDGRIAGPLGDIVIGGTTSSPTMIYDTDQQQAGFGAETDAFVASFADDGTLRWWAQYGGTGYDELIAIVRDDEGTTYVAGNYTGGFSMRNDRDSSGIPIPYAGAPTNGIFVVRHELSGRTAWVRTFPRGSESASAFAAGGDTLFLGGETDSDLVFDGVAIVSTAFRQAWVVALDTSGVAQWGQIYGVEENEEGELLRWMTADPDGNVYFSTRTNGGADYGGGAIPLTLGEGFTLVSLTSSGTHRFSRIFSDYYGEGGVSRMRFEGGHLLIAGWSGEDADLGAGVMPSTGRDDALVLQLSPEGAWRWSAVIGSSEWDGAHVVSTSDGQRLYGVLRLAGTVVVGGTTYGSGGTLLVRFDLPGGEA